MAPSDNIPKIRILQWNSNSLKRKTQELTKNIDSFDIALFSETWLTEKDNFYIRGFDVIRSNRSVHGQKGGGVAILVRNFLKYKVRNLTNNCNGKLEVSAIDLFSNRGNLVVVSCYRPPHGTISIAEWNNYFDQFKNVSSFIGGDFNVRCTSWGDSRNCNNGLSLESSLFDTDFVVLNQGQYTHIDFKGNSNSLLDLSLASSDLAMNSNWEVSSDSWNSDHLPLFISIN